MKYLPEWELKYVVEEQRKKLLRSIQKVLIQTPCKMWASLNQLHYFSKKIYSRFGKAHLLLN